MHERLRQYLLEKLREGLSLYQAIHDRHSQIYLALLQLDRAEFNRQTTLQRLTADFEEIWQQDQNQSHFSAAALMGLGWVALPREDWSAARYHFATVLPLIVQLETASQALEALAGMPTCNGRQANSSRRWC